MDKCLIEGCDKEGSKGICASHRYHRDRWGHPTKKPDGYYCSTGCGRASRIDGRCTKHHQLFQKWGPTMKRPPRLACSVDGCDTQNASHGLCRLHYDRVRRYGSATAVPPTCKIDGCETRSEDVCAMHRRRIEQTGTPDAPPERVTQHQLLLERIKDAGDECILWDGPKLPAGYGRLSVGNESEYSHRAALRAAKGDAPEGRPFATRIAGCLEPSCYNPNHLEWMSWAEGIAVRSERGIWDDAMDERRSLLSNR